MISQVTSDSDKRQIISAVREFVQRDVNPVASKYDEDDVYPHELIPIMCKLGLFGITIPVDYGGLGLDYKTFAMIFEEISKGWMSLSGILGTHHLLSHIIWSHGSENQKREYLPSMASGELRGGLALTESEAGSDVSNISTVATKEGEEYVINGRKMFISNGENGNVFALLAKTDPTLKPAHKGISCFIFRTPVEGFQVGQHIDKLGYRGIDTVELIFDHCRISIDNLIGHREGEGFYQVMDGLEVGRINVAARAVGVAQAAFDAALKYAAQRETFGKIIGRHQAIQLKLADMASKIHAARLMVYDAAEKKDQGQRNDVEAAMAKLFASEVCGEVVMESMRIHGGVGYTKGLPVERYYRDAPLMILGEGTNEIMKLLIGSRLLENYLT